MGRRITNGIVGTSGAGGLGNLTVDNVTVSTAITDDDIVLDPAGTGRILFVSDTQLQSQSDLRFADSDNSNWVAFQAPATVSSNVTWTLPSADGSTGQALVTNGSGSLSWAAAGANISDQTSSSSTFYPLFFSATTGSASAVNVASTKFTFQPSTGTLTVTSITESSSIALKTNIEPIENALEKLLALTGVIYDRKDGSRNREAGLIAEDVSKVLPNLVTTDRDGNPEGVQYTKITAYLIEAIKSLKNEIDSLKK